MTENDLRIAFEVYGNVIYVKINRPGDNSAAFAIIGMALKRDAKAAIYGLNGRQFKGMTIDVREVGVLVHVAGAPKSG